MSSQLKIIFTAGLAMFSMFFGSGNLVFTVKLGAALKENYFLAFLGFLITGVILPFAGLIAVMLYNGKREDFLGILGQKTSYILALAIVLLIGPCGVVPRCIIVAYGGLVTIYPDFPLILFSIVFSILMLLIIWDQNEIVPIIGKYLGPFKIGLIIIIIIAGLIFAPQITNATNPSHPLLTGLFEGYQTMDLPAAFFFSVTIFEYINLSVTNKDDLLKTGIFSGMIGAFLIGAIYFFLIAIGAHYSEILTGLGPEQYLAKITYTALGTNAAFILALTIFLSCLVTAAALSRLFAEFLHNDISGKRISWNKSVIITIFVSFILSLTGFSTIATILGTILTYVYPALVVLTLCSLLKKYYGFEYTKHAFWATIFIATYIKDFA